MPKNDRYAAELRELGLLTPDQEIERDREERFICIANGHRLERMFMFGDKECIKVGVTGKAFYTLDEALAFAERTRP